jgi:hypothetical protein
MQVVAATKAFGQQHTCMTGKLDRVGEGTSKHSSTQAHTAMRAAARELAGRDPEAQGKKGLNPAHSNMSLTDGKAGPGKEPAPPAV